MHKIMYDAFGWTQPELCHLPMVLGKDGHKLSKRHGATAVNEFRKAGYLPEALINYIAHLGCSFEDGRDIFTLEEMTRLFRVEHLNKAPAVFDYQKLEWYNGQYIKSKSDEALANLILPHLVEEGLVDEKQKTASLFEIQAIPLVKERLKLLSEAPGMMRYLYRCPDMPQVSEFIPKKLDKARTIIMLEECLVILGLSKSGSIEEIEEMFRVRAPEIGAKLGDLLMPLRVAITGARVSPPLFESILLLGYSESLKRITTAIDFLRSHGE
jgi:glutamyl-tRNA synthetase